MMDRPPAGYIPTEETAIDESRYVWEKLYRERTEAGREVPIVDVPRELVRTADGGEPDAAQRAGWEFAARMSVEATTDMARRAGRRSVVVAIDLAEMERQRAYYESIIAYHKRRSAACRKGWETRRRNRQAQRGSE